MVRAAVLGSCVSLACLLGVGVAEARERIRAVESRPLTVNKRSWLEPGNVVAVGTQNSYLLANTTLNQPVYNSYIPARFGQSTLPGQFDLAFSNENPRGPQSGGIFFDSDQ